MMIGRKALGTKGTDALIIAEIGSNWETIEDCQRSIQKAAEIGADVVKFQLFNFQSLYGLPESKRPTHYRNRSELPVEWLSQLKNECDNNQVELMVSCFGPDLVRCADPHVNCHKIASSEITNIDLIEEIAQYNKPVFLSTGSASRADIELALAILKGKQIVLNYCVGCYPAHSQDLFTIDLLRAYGHPVAISDHSLDFTYTPRAAVFNHGAVAIEKHLSCVNAITADSAVSLQPHQFKMMVDLIRGRRSTIIGPTADEIEFVGKAKRRIVATVDIHRGDDIIWGGNVGAYRSVMSCSDTVSPFYRSELRGRQATRDIKAGECIRTTDFTG